MFIFIYLYTFGSLGLPFTFFLCDDDLVSIFRVSLVVPPELVSIFPVFWTETRYILDIKTKYHKNANGHKHEYKNLIKPAEF